MLDCVIQPPGTMATLYEEVLRLNTLCHEWSAVSMACNAVYTSTRQSGAKGHIGHAILKVYWYIGISINI